MIKHFWNVIVYLSRPIKTSGVEINRYILILYATINSHSHVWRLSDRKNVEGRPWAHNAAVKQSIIKLTKHNGNIEWLYSGVGFFEGKCKIYGTKQYKAVLTQIIE